MSTAGRQTVRVVPHPYGSRKPRLMHEHISNLKEARARGIGHHDAHDYRSDYAHKIRKTIDARAPKARGGEARARYGADLKPLGHTLFARRLRPSEMRGGLIESADAYDVHEDVSQGAIYEVLAVGPKVRSVKPGDRVVAQAIIGEAIGDWYADDVFLLWADVEYVNDGDSDVERRSCGDVLAILEPDQEPA